MLRPGAALKLLGAEPPIDSAAGARGASLAPMAPNPPPPANAPMPNATGGAGGSPALGACDCPPGACEAQAHTRVRHSTLGPPHCTNA